MKSCELVLWIESSKLSYPRDLWADLPIQFTSRHRQFLKKAHLSPIQATLLALILFHICRPCLDLIERKNPSCMQHDRHDFDFRDTKYFFEKIDILKTAWFRLRFFDAVAPHLWFEVLEGVVHTKVAAPLQKRASKNRVCGRVIPQMRFRSTL